MMSVIHIFIVNPYAGRKTFAGDLREKLANIQGLNYFVFNTRYEGHEAELIKLVQYLFIGEKLRIYCCGGAGTMQNILNAIDDFSKVEIAFFPCGLTNSFIKSFGDNSERFFSIEELINGDVIKIDYIRTNHGIALNSFSLGADATNRKQIEKYRRLQMFGQPLPYAFSVLFTLLLSRPSEYIIEVDNDTYKETVTQLFFGNGNILGGMFYFFPTSNKCDGIGLYRFATGFSGISTLKPFRYLRNKRFKDLDNVSTFGESTRMRIKRVDGQPFSVNLDGNLSPEDTFWEATIVKSNLNFVVPKGVTGYD